MGRSRFFCAIVAATACVWLACVGTDPKKTIEPDPNVPAGQYRGACTAEGTCDAGLECMQGVCLYPPGVEPPPEGGADTGARDGGDAATLPACPYENTVNQDVPCPGSPACTSPLGCCIVGGSASCENPAACDMPMYKILNCATSCGSMPCCLQAQIVVDFGTCPAVMDIGALYGTACAGGPSCPKDSYVACKSDLDCTGRGLMTCHRLRLTGPNGVALVGVCR